jgi:adenine-specific DNA-methyltransferase
MDKLKMHSPDMTQENIKKIQALFPNCVTEARDENGKLRLAIDFDQLKQELSDSIVEGPQERYHLNWPGKGEAALAANAPIAKTLRPCRQESVDFDVTRNAFIEGDNLDALKLLQEAYLNKVKMIYLDPPYNTGNDFIYEDDFADDTKSYLFKSNQESSSGQKLVANLRTDGRYHSDWLSMMYSRIKLAKNLLSEDGFLLLSIDDNEFASIKFILDEFFGSEQYIGTFTINSTPNARDYGHIGKMHEYIHFYCKNKDSAISNQLAVTDKKFTYADELGGFNIHPLYNSNEAFSKANRPNLYYPFYVLPDSQDKNGFFQISLEKQENAIEVFPPLSNKNKVQFVWRWGKAKSLKFINKEIVGYKTGSGEFRIVQKMRHTTKIIRSILDSKDYTTRRGTAEVEEIFGKKIASFPKPLHLMKDLIQVCTDENSIVLDLFAGSATTAHAVMSLNAEDGGNRRFLLTQLPEQCDEKSEAFKAGYKIISEISKERIRRTGLRILERDCNTDWRKDVGFRVFKIDTSNINDVFYSPNQTSQSDLNLLVDHIKPDRNDEDLLVQVLLDLALELTLPITLKEVCGKSVYFVDENALVACFAPGINEDLVKELASFQPLQVVFRDDAFESNSMKINAEQIFKQLSPNTVVKAI